MNSAKLSRALALRFLEHQTHKPRRHRPRVTVDISLNHDTALIVQAGLDHRDGRLAIFVSAADQVSVRIVFELHPFGSKRQSNVSRAHYEPLWAMTASPLT